MCPAVFSAIRLTIVMLLVMSPGLSAFAQRCACGLGADSPSETSDAAQPGIEEFFETYADGSRPEPVSSTTATGPGRVSHRQHAQPQGALSGRIVFMGAGHGWTWGGPGQDGTGRWYTQRGVGHEMNEDYGNLDQMNFFAEYCFNAGATVVPTRPLGFQTNEVVLDNVSAGVEFSGEWHDSQSTVYYGEPGDVPYRFAPLAENETATAVYTPRIPVTGFYPVYTWARHGPDRTRQLYRINHTGGQTLVRVPHDKVGNGWIYLGIYYFEAGFQPARGSVEISNGQPDPPSGAVVIADAIRFGNGMGDVEPEPGAPVSGYPREEECSRYWVQAGLGQGQSTSIYDGPGNHASDNVGAPPRLAREMNREAQGSIFERIYISFHSNAGGGRGTIGLHNNPKLYPGTDTPNQERLAFLIGTEVNDIFSDMTSPPLETPWFKRTRLTYARNDYAFGEINNRYINDEFDATIIEIAFHDSAEDAKLLRDAMVRRIAARASYQAVLRYMNEFDDAPLVMISEPPRNVRAVGTPGGIVISWEAPSEAFGDPPDGYRVHQSTDGYGFGQPLAVGATTRSVTLSSLAPGQDFYFRVTAMNAGGESLPSETVGCRRAEVSAAPKVLFVNAFDRTDRRLNPRQTITARKYGPPGAMGTMERVIPRLSNAFDYVVPHGKALSASGVAFDSCGSDAVAGRQVKPGDYAAVIWALGNGSGKDDDFKRTEQEIFRSYSKAGGQLFISGAGEAVLAGEGFQARHGDAGAQTWSVSPVAGSIFSSRPPGRFDDGGGGIYCVRDPKVLSPVGNGMRAALKYEGEGEAWAALQSDGAAGQGRTVVFGFPFETVLGDSVRAGYMADTMKFFMLRDVQVLSPHIAGAGDGVQLTWPSDPGRKYQVQFKTSLASAIWRSFGAALTASAGELSAVDPWQGGNRFYRVLELGE